MVKAASNKKETLPSSKLDLHLKKKLVKFYTWSTTLCGAVTWTLRKVDQKYLESFEISCWGTKEMSESDIVRNEEVLEKPKEARSVLLTVQRRKVNWIGHMLCKICLLKHVI